MSLSLDPAIQVAAKQEQNGHDEDQRRSSSPLRREPPAALLSFDRPVLGGGTDRARHVLDRIRTAAPAAEQPDQRQAMRAVSKVEFDLLACGIIEPAVHVSGDPVLVRTRRGRPCVMRGSGGKQRCQVVRVHTRLIPFRNRANPQAQYETRTSQRVFRSNRALPPSIRPASASRAAWISRLARNGSGCPVRRATSASVRSCS